MLFGLCRLAMCKKVCGLQVVMRSSRVVRGCLMMMLDGKMGCLGSHEKFLLKVDKRYDFVPRLVELLLSVPLISLAPQHLSIDGRARALGRMQ